MNNNFLITELDYQVDKKVELFCWCYVIVAQWSNLTAVAYLILGSLMIMIIIISIATTRKRQVKC